ncbi:hypothetical protein PTQ19_02295 [Microbacterium esteraromaticum]|uniref:LamG-like jellyroll fold domain-containing protein n=1 Tax=Microbacterium esteraromaticum TaxID=57043 RepID=UPI002368A417|nr:LamG-like jellyroll fold domain-containing protein [Microbacterium esteraromaticum]WDH79297.1 hypothetical protein PTQ19_02295 [Microbacterium esteraromaticum]
MATATADPDAAIAAAQAEAEATGEPVVVDEMTSPTELTSAMPDGTMQYEVATRPVRAEKDGAWVPVDTDLVRDGEWLVPEASAVPVRFSTGGSDALAQVQSASGDWVSETWPYGDLPTPTVEGDTATYEAVFPGVDLKLAATKTGMASIYVVWSEEAALSAPLESLHVAIGGATLTKDAAGTVVADPAGAATPNDADLVAGQPLWWDSSEGGTYREPGGEAPPMPVEHEVTTNSVKMDIGESLAAVQERVEAPTVQYPIFVDPDWSSGESASWYTDAAYPNQSYLSAGVSDRLRVGIYQQYRSDMFFQVPISGLAGKQIIAAHLNTRQLSVNACGAKAIGIHTFGPKTAGFTWNQEQSWNAAGTAGWSGPLQATWTGPDCGSAALNVNWNVTKGVQAKVGASLIQFAVTYADPNAPSRRHYSRDATLKVSYNSRPNVPTAQTMTAPPRPCAATAATAVGVPGPQVTVSVKSTDPDAGNVGTDFYVYKSSDLSNPVQKVARPAVAQGTQSGTFTGLAEGQTYAWRALANDTRLQSGFTSFCYFVVDNTAPAAPGLSTSATTFEVGKPVTVNLTSAADVLGYQYWVQYSAFDSNAAAQPSPVAIARTAAMPDCNKRSGAVRFACKSATTITVAPTDSFSTLWVSAYDRAGNVSVAKALPLYRVSDGTPAAVGAGTSNGHMWSLSSESSPLPTSISDANPGGGASALSLSLPASVDKSVTDVVDAQLGAIPVIKAQSRAAGSTIGTGSAPLNAENSFTVSLWVKPDNATRNQVIMSQGTAASGVVQLKLAGGKYAFCITGTAASGEDATLVSGCATAASAAVSGKWVLLTGILDTANQQLRLVIGDKATPTAVTPHKVGSGDWTANSALQLAPDPDSSRFYGMITNPAIVPAVLTSNQLYELSQFGTPF